MPYHVLYGSAAASPPPVTSCGAASRRDCWLVGPDSADSCPHRPDPPLLASQPSRLTRHQHTHEGEVKLRLRPSSSGLSMAEGDQQLRAGYAKPDFG